MQQDGEERRVDRTRVPVPMFKLEKKNHDGYMVNIRGVEPALWTG